MGPGLPRTRSDSTDYTSAPVVHPASLEKRNRDAVDRKLGVAEFLLLLVHNTAGRHENKNQVAHAPRELP
jgi:hypothetical protein